MTKTNAYDIAQDIIDESEEYYTRDEVLEMCKGDVLLAIDYLMEEAVTSHEMIIPEEHQSMIRARLGRYLRY